MDYDDQLVATGQVNDVGAPLRENVESSYRAGIEIQAGVLILKKLNWETNLTFSQNKIADFNYLVFDFSGNIIENTEMKDTDISFSPEIIANSTLNYNVNRVIDLAWTARYIGEQFLDNTSSSDKMLDAYFVNDFRAEINIPTKLLKRVQLIAMVNNVFSENYASNGYTYSYYSGSVVTENFVFPQAFRNYMLALNLKF